MKKLTEFKRTFSAELRDLGREGTFTATLSMFTQHPEVLGVMWMYRVPIRDWSEDVVKLGDADKYEQDVTLPRALISTDLAEGLAIPSYYKLLPNLGEVSVVRADTIDSKLPAIAVHLYELCMSLRELKLTLGPAWGEKKRIIVYRQGADLDIETTDQTERDLAYHEDMMPDHLLRRKIE